jgi:monofunctional biosynthetic peptidoglycan transglycosylase
MTRKSKTSRLKSKILFILTLPLLVLLFILIGWTARAVIYWTYPVAALKTDYPLVEFSQPGGKLPAQVTVSLQKKRPPGWVSFSQISKHAIHAVIVSEDWSFFEHAGYDLEELKASFQKNLAKGMFARGGSTLTQQTVKNVFLSREKSLWRKIKELILALKMEEELSKTKILEVYFNVVEWDRGVYGISNASNHYFGKSPGTLNPKEAAFLAMLLPGPKKYSVSFHKRELTPFARSRIRDILGKMEKAHFISEEERTLWLNTPLSFENRATLTEIPSAETITETSTEPTEEMIESEETD